MVLRRKNPNKLPILSSIKKSILSSKSIVLTQEKKNKNPIESMQNFAQGQTKAEYNF